MSPHRRLRVVVTLPHVEGVIDSVGLLTQGVRSEWYAPSRLVHVQRAHIVKKPVSATLAGLKFRVEEHPDEAEGSHHLQRPPGEGFGEIGVLLALTGAIGGITYHDIEDELRVRLPEVGSHPEIIAVRFNAGLVNLNAGDEGAGPPLTGYLSPNARTGTDIQNVKWIVKRWQQPKGSPHKFWRASIKVIGVGYSGVLAFKIEALIAGA